MGTEKPRKILTVTNILILTTLVLSIASLVLASNKKEYSESLFTSNLNNSTLRESSSLQTLYSYPVSSGNGSNHGYFTIVFTGPSSVPNISFDVRDQLDKRIITGTPVVGKITRIHFQGNENSTEIKLYISPKQGGINLESLTINLL